MDGEGEQIEPKTGGQEQQASGDQVPPEPVVAAPTEQVSGEQTAPLAEADTSFGQPSGDQVLPEPTAYGEKSASEADETMQAEPLREVLGSRGEETRAIELSDQPSVPTERREDPSTSEPVPEEGSQAGDTAESGPDEGAGD